MSLRGGENSLTSAVRAGLDAVIGQRSQQKLHEMKSSQPEPRGWIRDANIAKIKYMVKQQYKMIIYMRKVASHVFFCPNYF